MRREDDGVITVAVVEDDPLVRRSLAGILNRGDGVRCVGQCANGEEALRELPGLAPRVVLMDLQLPGMDGVECVRKLSGLLPAAHIVMLTVHEDTEAIFRSLSAGANGYLLKPIRAAQLLAAVRDVFAGGAPMASNIARKVVQAFRQPAASRSTAEELSPRELEVLPGNFRPNPGFELGDNLDSPQGTPAGWNRGGNDGAICQVSTARAISPTHSLAVVDQNAAGYGEWYCDQALACSAREGRAVNIQWFELFDVSAGGEMRFTILFFNAANGVVGESHYVAKGQSAGWTGDLATSPFVRRNVQLAIPVGARTMRTSLVSGGSQETTGTMLIDNLSVALEPTPPTVLFGNLWPNAAFEDGTNLDNPAAGLPTGWQRGGNDAAIDLVTPSNYTSSTRALAVVDNNNAGYGEWYANLDLTGRATDGDVLNLQWFELYNVSTGGTMRLSLLFWDPTNTLLLQVHYTASGPSAGWAGDIACSSTTPAGTANGMRTFR